MSYGKLYGVGVGTGSPDLMTLRAVNILRQVAVIAIPQSSPHIPSVAWRIAEPSVGEVAGQERLRLTFPMSRDPKLVAPAWERALHEIGARLERGVDLAFITEGDPLFYSTYIYLHREASVRWPGIDIEVVPAVSSIGAASAATGIPIADGQENVAVLAANYNLDKLPQILKLFDTILLLKVSSVMPELVELLEKEHLLERAVYVSRATMPYQKIVYDLKSIGNDKCDYFSMVIVARQERSGLLLGKSRRS